MFAVFTFGVLLELPPPQPAIAVSVSATRAPVAKNRRRWRCKRVPIRSSANVNSDSGSKRRYGMVGHGSFGTGGARAEMGTVRVAVSEALAFAVPATGVSV